MEGQVAIVTGGAMGIGKEYVNLLLSRKLKVCIADVNDTKASETIRELSESHKDAQLMFQHCDVTDEGQFEEAIKNTLEKFGRLDVLINNAGIADESRYKLTLAIDLNAVITGIMLGLKYMSTANGGNGGSIISTSSIAGVLQQSLFPAYTAAKFGIVGFTRSIGATSITTHGIRINCICPGGVDTLLVAGALTSQSAIYGGKEDHENFKEMMKELMQPSQVAECLNPLLDDVTLSGAVMLCMPEHPQTVLKMPETLEDIYKTYVKE